MSRLKNIFQRPNFTKFGVTLFDAVVGGLCMFAAVRLRYAFDEKAIPSNIDENAGFVFVISTLCVWIVTRKYRAIWRFTSLDDIKNLMKGVLFVSILTPVILFLFFGRALHFPRTAPFIAGALFFAALTFSRIAVLFFQNGDIRAIFRGKKSDNPGAILVGSASSLHNYLRDMDRKASGPGYNIIGLIDTGSKNSGRSIRGYPILGELEDIQLIYLDINRREGRSPTLIATDTKSDKAKSYSLVKVAAQLGAPLVRVSRGQASELTRFEAADLIGRDVKALDISPVRRLIKGRRVMITGAGGTIGSEIARQVAGLNPASLALVDASEFNIYEIDRKLTKDFSNEPELNWFPYIANICDPKRMREIFKKERPEIILHAAALKHVHLSEVNPIETLKTNVGGTDSLVRLAAEFGASSFTLISTDKAVNPTNIMGASKLIAEKLTLASASRNPNLAGCAVRFGNVLASTGSVVPLFEEQIANGGPVTVTHRDVKRFFMTTEEAAALVLQAAALNATQRSEVASIYVLEMGEPVKIAKLARQLIRLRGLIPDKDIKIEYTELRAGEKISERLITTRESLETTYVDGIRRISSEVSADPKSVMRRVDRLLTAVDTRNPQSVQAALTPLIPGFKPNRELSPTPDVVESAEIIPLPNQSKD